MNIKMAFAYEIDIYMHMDLQGIVEEFYFIFIYLS